MGFIAEGELNASDTKLIVPLVDACVLNVQL